jgi:predicted nuclease of predicted toxin-antitoxin system
MIPMLRFHLDGHIDSAIADGLRRRGIDVTTTPEVGLRGAGDDAHVAFALSEGRVVVTNDADFLRLHRQGVRHAGIAFTRHGLRSIGELLRALVLLCDCLEAEDIGSHVEYVESRRPRWILSDELRWRYSIVAGAGKS